MTVNDIVKYSVSGTKIRLYEDYRMVAETIVGRTDDNLKGYLNWEVEMITAINNILEVYL